MQNALDCRVGSRLVLLQETHEPRKLVLQLHPILPHQYAAQLTERCPLRRRFVREYTMHETKSASVGIPSGLPMNSLNSGPIHGRTVSTMPVLQQNHCGACPSPVGGPFASYILQHVARGKKKNGKRAKKLRNFQFLGGWWSRMCQNLA